VDAAGSLDFAALAAASADPKKKKNKGAEEHVPYRDSVEFNPSLVE
jgi:hypothetical protein